MSTQENHNVEEEMAKQEETVTEKRGTASCCRSCRRTAGGCRSGDAGTESCQSNH